jgi:hypothetical protein
MGRCGFVVSVGIAVIASAATAAGAERTRAVVELFTSQGCSSCPPADKLIGELSEDSSVVALSLPIDYWDYLGWKDTLAKPRHTARQRAYAAMRGDREVYTPQVVVDGVLHVAGNDKAAIEQMILKTRERAGVLTVPVTAIMAAGKLQVTVPARDAAAAAPASGEVWLCVLTRRMPIAIKRGENSGRTVTYNNVVRRWVKLGEWNGAAHTWTVPASDFAADGADEVAVLVQAGNGEHPGPMLGAAVAALH